MMKDNWLQVFGLRPVLLIRLSCAAESALELYAIEWLQRSRD
jgi:hypothetical protein